MNGVSRTGASDEASAIYDSAESEPNRRQLVSIIVPCYNARPFIRMTVQSVLSQSYDCFELIIVDDRSNDGSVEVLKELAALDSRIILLEMERNAGGPAAPRNRGVREARGAWLAFLDADDVWHPRKLEFQMNALRKYNALACSTQMRDFHNDSEVVFEEPGAVPVTKVTLLQQLIKYRTPTSSVIVRRELLPPSPFKEDLQFKAREDTDCFTRIHEYMDHSIKLQFPFVYYRQQGSQISGNKFHMIGRHLNMLKKYRLRSGRSLGAKAYLYTFTHFSLALYYRWFRKML